MRTMEPMRRGAPADSTVTARSTDELATLAVVGAACLFGATGTIAAIGPTTLAPFAAGVWRSVIGAAVLVVIAATRGAPVFRGSNGRRWIWVGGFGVAVYQLAFFVAVARTGVALGTLITIGLGPLVAGLLDVLITRRRPGVRWMFGTLVAICGVSLLTAGAADPDPIGIALAVAAACSFPLYGVALQRLFAERGFTSAIASVFGAGALLLAPLAAVTATDVWSSWDAGATVVTLGVVTLAAAYVLWGIGLRSLPLSVVVTATLVEPAVAAGLAVLVLGEPFTATLLLGLLLVGAGVRLSTRSAGRNRRRHARRSAGRPSPPPMFSSRFRSDPA